MDEIEYKLNTNNSVLIVNAVDKLISAIKSKFKPTERQKFVMENEELKFLRDKCSSKQSLVSLTACQGLLALVELRVLEIAHTMSTVVTLLPSAHNYSGIISTIAGLLILDLRSRLVPGQPYRCQFNLRSPQHPFITVMEKNKDAEDDVLMQMHALCNHPDYVVSSNSLELLRPVFLWLTSNPQRHCSLRPWQLLLSLPSTPAQEDLLLACISCQQVSNPEMVERAFAAYSAVTDSAIYRQRHQHLMALLPLLARMSNELVKHGRDPRACYTLIERGFSADAAELRPAAGLTVSLLADNLTHSSALHLHELFNLCLNIISKYDYSTLSLSTFTALSLQWIHLPSHLTASALKTASQLLEKQRNSKQDSRLFTPNLKANKIFQNLLYTDCRLSIVFKINQTWERIKDDKAKLKHWLDSLQTVDNVLKMELLPFFFGIIMERRQEKWYQDIVIKTLKIVVSLVDFKKEVTVQLLPLLLYKIANDPSPNVKMEFLKALPLMAKTKENIPPLVSILNKLKTKKGVPTSFLIMLYTSLAETQVRCFPFLHQILVETGTNRPDDLKWEIDLARSVAVKRMCDIRPSSHGCQLVCIISSTLNRCTDKPGAGACGVALGALGALWRGAAVAPPSAWRALSHKLPGDTRPAVQTALCRLLADIPALRTFSPEYDVLITEVTRKLWSLMTESHHPHVVEAACDALANFKVEDFKLADLPEIYRRTVRLPASYCKTPIDAERNPEDVLDYIPCEVWPEVFRHTNQAALGGVTRLCARLVERELRGFRGGYARAEPPEPLSPASVIRGLTDCLRRQATRPSYEWPECVLAAMLSALCTESPRPLPALELAWLAERAGWRRAGLRVAARALSASARRIVDACLKDAAEGKLKETEILEVFELLPILCRNMPPNSLRSPIERCLHESYQDTLKYKNKHADKNSKDMASELLFVKQMDIIRGCLECDKIHDANRTLLSQIVENYFNIIEDDNIAWAAYTRACCALPVVFLERATSPSSWWEVAAPALRRACAVRAAMAAAGGQLTWLNELIDAQAIEPTGQEYSLHCMLPALKAANPDEESTRDWLLQLMARTQAAFKESSDDSAKLYLCDVFMLSAVALSGLWACEAGDVTERGARAALLPAAVAALCARPVWSDKVAQMLEWLLHTRDAAAPAVARAAQRALLALRHARAFREHAAWTRLESYFARTVEDEN